MGVTILTVLGGLAAYYLTSFQFSPFYWKYLFFYVPYIAAVSCTLKSLWHLANALAKGWQFKYTPDANTVGQYIQDLISANDATNPEVRLKIRAAFIKNFGNLYKQDAAANFYTNTLRQKEILPAYRMAMFALALLLLTSIPFFVLKSGFQDDITMVKIINPVEIKNDRK